jgi:hypothetical protein
MCDITLISVVAIAGIIALALLDGAIRRAIFDHASGYRATTYARWRKDTSEALRALGVAVL